MARGRARLGGAAPLSVSIPGVLYDVLSVEPSIDGSPVGISGNFSFILCSATAAASARTFSAS
ncbi:MAG: hypothetical protein JRM90_08325, partial [Nitrososphaerota archaeon]|nr:hypothetical protein [Nitrososphaerota archaeon]